MEILTTVLLGGLLAFQAPEPPEEETKPLQWKLDQKGSFLVKWKYEENIRYREKKFKQLKGMIDQRSVEMLWSQPEKRIRGVFVVKVKKARWVYQDVKFRIVLDYVAGKPVRVESYVRKIFAPLSPELRNIDMVRARQELELKVAGMKNLLEQKYVLSIRENDRIVIHRSGTAIQERDGTIPVSLFNSIFVSPSLSNKVIARGGRWWIDTPGDLPFGKIKGAVHPVLKVRSCSGKDILMDSSSCGRVGTKPYSFSMRIRYAKDGYVKSIHSAIRNGNLRKTMTLTMKRV